MDRLSEHSLTILLKLISFVGLKAKHRRWHAFSAIFTVIISLGWIRCDRPCKEASPFGLAVHRKANAPKRLLLGRYSRDFTATRTIPMSHQLCKGCSRGEAANVQAPKQLAGEPPWLSTWT